MCMDAGNDAIRSLKRIAKETLKLPGKKPKIETNETKLHSQRPPQVKVEEPIHSRFSENDLRNKVTQLQKSLFAIKSIIDDVDFSESKKQEISNSTVSSSQMFRESSIKPQRSLVKTMKPSLSLTQTSKTKPPNSNERINSTEDKLDTRNLEKEVAVLTLKLKKMEEQRNIDRAKLLSLQASVDSPSTVKMSFNSIGDVDSHIAEQIDSMSSTLDNLSAENRILTSKLKELQQKYDYLLSQNQRSNRSAFSLEYVEDVSNQELEIQRSRIMELERNLEVEKEKVSNLEITNEQLQVTVSQMEAQLEQFEFLYNYTETSEQLVNEPEVVESDASSFSQLNKQVELNISDSALEDSSNIFKLEQLFLKTYNALKKARTSQNPL